MLPLEPRPRGKSLSMRCFKTDPERDKGTNQWQHVLGLAVAPRDNQFEGSYPDCPVWRCNPSASCLRGVDALQGAAAALRWATLQAPLARGNPLWERD